MAITKLHRIVEDITSRTGGAVLIVKGYQYAKITVDVTSGTVSYGIYGRTDMEDPTSADTRPIVYYNNRIQANNINNLGIGRHEIFIEVDSIAKMFVSQVKSGDFNGKAVVSTYYEELGDNKKEIPSDKKVVFNNRDTVYIPLPVNAKQFDAIIRPLGVGYSGQYIVKGSKDGIVWEDLVLINTNLEVLTTGSIKNTVPITDKVVHIYAKVEGYSTLRVFFNASTLIPSSFLADFKVSEEYIEREIPYTALSTPNGTSLYTGYKYAKIDYSGFSTKDITYISRCRPFKGDSYDTGKKVPIKVYNSNMEPMDTPWYRAGYDNIVTQIFGHVIDGKAIIEIDGDYDGIYWGGSSPDGLAGSSLDLKMRITLTNERPESKEMPLVKETNDYNIYQLPPLGLTTYPDGLRRDVAGLDVIEYSQSKIYFYLGGYHGFKYEIDFNIENAPALSEGEVIKFAYLLPFDPVKRGANVGTLKSCMRISIFTNKGRIFHNFPDRKSGGLPSSDMMKFEESGVYNWYKKWLPVNDKSKTSATRKYLPVLAEYDYSQFEGRVTGTAGFVDYFNTGGIQEKTGYTILDKLVADHDTWQRLTYGSMAKDSKLSIFANYNVITGAEPVVIGTSDGGKTWYVKAWFAYTDAYNRSRGGVLDFTPITGVSGAYVPNSLKVSRRRFNIPTNEVKEPSTPFIIREEESSLVTNISVSEGTVLITTADNVDWDLNYPIIFFENISAHSEWDYICNAGFNESGTINNGVFFRAEKVAPNQYRLYGDVGNPYESDLLARHLHCANRTQGGYLISTGEGYPESGKIEGGFLYYIQQGTRNGSDFINPERRSPILRLTSSMGGVNRASGAYLFNDSGTDPTLIVASDDTVALDGKRNIQIPGRTIKIEVPPIGIYKGKLSDIDDLSKFECISEVKETLVSLIEHQGNFVADGHSGAINISKGGFKWNIESNELRNGVNGLDCYGNIYFGNKVIKFK